MRGFNRKHHSHHLPPQGYLFGVAVNDGEKVVGVVTIGRPVARRLQDGYTAEVTRCCTNGTKNAASMLYAAAWRAAKAIGYRRLITYTLDTEKGTSIQAAGWREIGKAGGGGVCGTFEEVIEMLEPSTPEIVTRLVIENQRLRARIEQMLEAYDLEVKVGFPKYQENCVYINDDFHFEDVEREVWDFHIGGYQVLEKWLADRIGRRLTFDDIEHYDKIVIALRETLKIQTNIDEIIHEHGGFPLPGSTTERSGDIDCECKIWPGRKAGRHHELCRKNRGS